MKGIDDQTLARRFLEVREKGYSLGLVVRWGYSRYLFIFSAFALGLLVFASEGRWNWFCIFLGLTIGFAARDAAWIRASKSTWPFTAKVTDWEQVQRFADGESNAQQGRLTEQPNRPAADVDHET